MDPLGSLNARKAALKLDFKPPADKLPTLPTLTPEQHELFSNIMKSPEFETIRRDIAASARLMNGLKDLQTPFPLATPTPTKLFGSQGNESNEQRQYAQGFLDALIHIQKLDGFKYDQTLVSPSLVTPVLRGQVADPLMSPLLSPHNTLDLNAVIQAFSNPVTPVCSAPPSLPSILNALDESRLGTSSLPSAFSAPLSSTFLQASASTSVCSTVSSSSSSAASASSSGALLAPSGSNSLNLSSFPTTSLNLPPPLPFNAFKFSADPLPTMPSFPTRLEQPEPFSQEMKIEIPCSKGSISDDDMSSRSSSTGPSSAGGRILPSKSGDFDGVAMYGYNQPSTMQHYPQHHVPQHHPYMPLEHTIHVDENERRKLERKRLRNRMAASKCRQKKLEKIQELEQLVNEEKYTASKLDQELATLRLYMEDLQRKAMYHAQNGCPLPPILHHKLNGH